MTQLLLTEINNHRADSYYYVIELYDYNQEKYVRNVYLITAFLSMTVSFHSTAQQAGSDQAFEQKLSNQERAEYQNRLGHASGEQERNEINAQYRKMVEDRTQSQSDRKPAQQKAGTTSGSGHGKPATSQSSPSGSKSKPQKSGH
jgi:hypothetical protein